MKIDKKSRKEILEKMRRAGSTQGYKKLWAYFLDITKKDYFQNTIKKLGKTIRYQSMGLNQK